MERIFFFNLKSELKNFVVVDAQSRSGNFAHINENSAKWTTPGAISHIIFGIVINLTLHGYHDAIAIRIRTLNHVLPTSN